jgi:hypothetical protein
MQILLAFFGRETARHAGLGQCHHLMDWQRKNIDGAQSALCRQPRSIRTKRDSAYKYALRTHR